MSESSIFGHQTLICQTCCVPPTVLLCSPFADMMATEAIRSAGKGHQKPHVDLSAPITGWARSQLIDETKQFLWLKVYIEIKHCIFIRCSFDFSLITILALEGGGRYLSHIRQRKSKNILGRDTLYLSGMKNRTYLLADSSPGRYFPLLHCFSWQHDVLTLEASECLY